MAKYKVTSSDVVEQRKTWIIDAESEDEALDIASESEPKNVQMLYLDVETVWEAKDVTPGD
jgi:DNA (cytosine-5)-methyltransferase 1